MELDAMQKDEEESGEEFEEGSEEEVDEVLFFMAPNHEKLRSREDIEAQDYWEAGIMAEAISTLKQGNMDKSQKTCYHCNWKGHIKAELHLLPLHFLPHIPLTLFLVLCMA